MADGQAGGRGKKGHELRVTSQKPSDPRPATRDPRLSNRDGIGAQVKVWAGGRQQVKEARSGSSYLSQNDLRLHFGLGASAGVDSVIVRWPGGLVQRMGGFPSNRLLFVREGEGYEVKPREDAK
ncbi:MAG: hypothetical protein EXS64_21000 [Candidatus Latescibacteria bacterium]|nr:hypothetical protein [Candidatus Latescibacterota bacterium]